MRVIHIVHGKANPAGHNGISRVVYHLNKQEKAQGVRSEIWAVVDGVRHHHTHPRDEHVTVECFPRVRWPFARHEIIDRLLAQKDGIDLVHFHMIWFYDKNVIAKALVRAGIPYIVTTHGTYSKPHALTGRRRIARRLYELSYLNAATEIHAITGQEQEALRTYGYRGPCFVAPNGIALEEVPQDRRTDFFRNGPGADKLRLLWVGVPREDKNLGALIDAVAMLQPEARNQLVVSIVGPDWNDNIARFRAKAEQKGVGAQFVFHGPLYGPEKFDAIESSDLYILPSVSEVFALAMLDAMACGKPCLVSTGCGYEPYRDRDFFLSFEPCAPEISAAIAAMLARRGEWPRMGRNARRVIEDELNWTRIAETMIRNYERIAAAR